MRVTLYFWLILILSVSNVTSQNCDYKKYYFLFDLAQENYRNKNYKEAEKNIKLAINQTEFPLGEGLQLALQIANKQKDSEWAEQIAIKLAKGGIPLKFFKNERSYKWYPRFKANFKQYENHYNEVFDSALRHQVLSLLKRDKEFNTLYHQWRMHKTEMTQQELNNGALQIFLDFKKITDKYGFPDERLMGYNYVARKNKIEYYKLDALMIHTYQRGVLFLKDEIPQIICQGGLHPNYKEILSKTRGYGDSSGIEQEMKMRYEKF